MPLDPKIVALHGGRPRRISLTAWTIFAALFVATATAQSLPRKDLAQCIQIALEQHPELKAAAAEVDAGHARTWQAISGALPQVNADYSASRRHNSFTSRTGGPIGPEGQAGNQARTFNFYSTGISLSQI